MALRLIFLVKSLDLIEKVCYNKKVKFIYGGITLKQAQFYKPSNTFSFVGFILMFVSMLFAGVAMSWLYVILQAFIPLIYLCVLITIGFGAAIGGIGLFFVKAYKIRHPMMAMAATLIAMLFVYFFHWCVYVARDYDKNIYDYMKKQDAASYYVGLTDSQIEQAGYDEVINYFKSKSIRTVTFTSKEREYFTTKQEKNYNKGVTVWEFYDFDKVLGTSNDEAVSSLKAMKGKNAYSFFYEYRNQPKHSIGYLLVHPGDLWEDIKDINKVGRWTMRSSRSSYSNRNSTSNSNVNGIFLWLTWLGEMALMFIPAAAIVAAKAKSPFIEQDNDWAITDKPEYAFKFVDPFPGNNQGEKQFKTLFMNDIDCVFSLQPLAAQMGQLNTFYTIKYCHSRNYTENYITILHTRVTNPKNNQRATSAIVKNALVDADYIATLHAMFNYPVPQGCPGVNKFAKQTAEQEQQAQQEQAYQQQNYQQSYQQPQEQAYQEQAYQQPQEQAYQEQAYQQPQEQAYQEPTAENFGDMDGIDTSNIDLSSLDDGMNGQ